MILFHQMLVPCGAFHGYPVFVLYFYVRKKLVNKPKPTSMKHFWKYIAGALAFALPIASCSDDNTSDFPDKEWSELTAPVLTVSDEEITLDADKADQEALRFSWTAAAIVTRSSSVMYDLYLNVEGEDLFKGIKREWGGGSRSGDLFHPQGTQRSHRNDIRRQKRRTLRFPGLRLCTHRQLPHRR